MFDIGGKNYLGSIQDRHGFFWFTYFVNGLVRFNRKSKHVLRAGADSFSNDFTPKVLENSQGIIWIGTSNDLNRNEK